MEDCKKIKKLNPEIDIKNMESEDAIRVLTRDITYHVREPIITRKLDWLSINAELLKEQGKLSLGDWHPIFCHD